MRLWAVAVLGLVVPQAARADCVYTGAKRAYIECIYNSVLTTAAEVFGLDARLGTTETTLSAVEADVSALMSSFVTLEGDLANVETTLADLDTEVGGLSGDLADLTDAVNANTAAIAAIGGAGSVLQTHAAVYSSGFTTSSCNTDEQVFSTSFTPTSATSSILVEITAPLNCSNLAGADPHTACYLRVKRGASLITTGEYFAGAAHVNRTMMIHAAGVLAAGSTDPITFNVTLHGRCSATVASLPSTAGSATLLKITEIAN